MISINHDAKNLKDVLGLTDEELSAYIDEYVKMEKNADKLSQLIEFAVQQSDERKRIFMLLMVGIDVGIEKGKDKMAHTISEILVEIMDIGQVMSLIGKAISLTKRKNINNN